MDNAEKLAALFHGLPRAYGEYRLEPVVVPGGNGQKSVSVRDGGAVKRDGRAITVRKPVVLALYVRHLAGEVGLGIVPLDDEGRAWFGAIDIDVYNLDHKQLEAQCMVLNLPLMVTTTKSGGAHLYCFTKGVTAGLLRRRLQEWSSALGYPNAEVFPKQSQLATKEDTGNWINLPYFAWDIDDNVRYGIFSGERLSLGDYCARAEELRVDEEKLKALVMDGAGAFEDGPPCLQAMSRTGFPQGTRNNGLFAIGVYLRKRYGEDYEGHLWRYNETYLKPPLSGAEIESIVKSLNRKKYNYKCDEPPIRDHCNRSVCRTRKFGVKEAGAGKDEWGVMVDSDAQIILTDPPYYLVNVNGTRLKLFAEDLLYQRNFQKACMERIRYMPPMLDAETWRGVVNNIINHAEPIEAAHDSGAAGEATYHLRQFCTVRMAESKEEVLKGLPFEEAGETFFRASDFKRYLEAQHYRALTGAKLYAALKELAGLNYRTIAVGSKSVHVWVVPAHDRNVIPMPPRVPRDPGM